MTGPVLRYAVSLPAEVSEVEGREAASTGLSSGLHHCLEVYLVEELQRSSQCTDLLSFDSSWDVPVGRHENPL